MAGPNSAKAGAAFARSRQRVIEEGDLVMIHANTCADGYWTDLTRTYTAGQSSQRQRDMRTAICEARTAGLAAIRPGATGQQVDHAARSVMKAHGFGKAFKHAAGHGVGFAAANPNGRPRIHPLSPDVLEEGMTFNLEPAAYFDDYGGMRRCDLIAVTNDGARVMSDF
jgi:Xaa-Pro aminopeptidase